MLKIAVDIDSPVLSRAMSLIVPKFCGQESAPVDQADTVLCDTLDKTGRYLELGKQVILFVAVRQMLGGSVPDHARLRVFQTIGDDVVPGAEELFAHLSSLKTP